MLKYQRNSAWIADVPKRCDRGAERPVFRFVQY